MTKEKNLDQSDDAAPRRPKTRPYGPRAVSDLIGGALSEAARKRGFIATEILTLWPELVGREISGGSLPGEIKWPRRSGLGGTSGGTLLVFADGPTALLISHDTPRILERINRLFGYDAISAIRVSQRAIITPPPPRRRLPIMTLDDELALSRRLSAVEDPDLRASLERLGRNVVARNKRP